MKGWIFFSFSFLFSFIHSPLFSSFFLYPSLSIPLSLSSVPLFLSPISYPLSPIPYFLFPIPYPLFPIPYPLFPISYPISPIPYPLSHIPYPPYTPTPVLATALTATLPSAPSIQSSHSPSRAPRLPQTRISSSAYSGARFRYSTLVMVSQRCACSDRSVRSDCCARSRGCRWARARWPRSNSVMSRTVRGPCTRRLRWPSCARQYSLSR